MSPRNTGQGSRYDTGDKWAEAKKRGGAFDSLRVRPWWRFWQRKARS